MYLVFTENVYKNFTRNGLTLSCQLVAISTYQHRNLYILSIADTEHAKHYPDTPIFTYLQNILKLGLCCLPR